MILYISFLIVIWRENIDILISQEQLQDWSPDFPLFVIVSVFPFRINRKRREWRNTFYEPKGRGWIKWVDRKEHSLVIRHAPSVNHCDIMYFLCVNSFFGFRRTEKCVDEIMWFITVLMLHYIPLTLRCVLPQKYLSNHRMCCSRSALIPVSLKITWPSSHV